MSKIDFDGLGKLSISELGAIIAHAKEQMDYYYAEMKKMEKAKGGEIYAQGNSITGSYYEQLGDCARNALDEKIFAITGRPN